MAASRLFEDAMPRRWDAAVPVDGVDGSTDAADGVGRLYDRFAAGLYRYALIVLADPDAAADVIQQVFTAMVAKQGRKEALKDGERYLRRAVRNECFSRLRSRSRRQTVSDAPLLEAVAPGVDPAEQMAIEQALRSLPADQREVIHLKVFEGMTFREIADQTGESINTIGSRYRSRGCRRSRHAFCAREQRASTSVVGRARRSCSRSARQRVDGRIGRRRCSVGPCSAGR